MEIESQINIIESSSGSTFNNNVSKVDPSRKVLETTESFQDVVENYTDDDKKQEDQSNSGLPPGYEKKIDTVVPISIRKMLSISENTKEGLIEWDGHPIDHVVVFGRLVSVNDAPSRAIVEINDATGKLKLIVYKFSNHEPPAAIKAYNQKGPNRYVKAVFITRVFNDEKIRVCQELNEVEDYNEITSYMERLILMHLQRTRGYLRREDYKESSQKIKPRTINEESLRLILDSATLDDNEKILNIIQLFNGEKNEGALFHDLSQAFGAVLSDSVLRTKIAYLIEKKQIFESKPNTYSLVPK